VLLGYIWRDVEDLLEEVFELFNHRLIDQWLDIIWYFSDLITFFIKTNPISLIKYIFCDSENEFRHFLRVHGAIAVDSFGLLNYDRLLALSKEFVEIEFRDWNVSFFTDNMERSLD